VSGVSPPGLKKLSTHHPSSTGEPRSTICFLIYLVLLFHFDTAA
jgi:hypothetical protein